MELTYYDHVQKCTFSVTVNDTAHFLALRTTQRMVYCWLIYKAGYDNPRVVKKAEVIKALQLPVHTSVSHIYDTLERSSLVGYERGIGGNPPTLTVLSQSVDSAVETAADNGGSPARSSFMLKLDAIEKKIDRLLAIWE